MARWWRRPAVAPIAAVLGLVVVAAVLVTLTLRQPEVAKFTPTVSAPREVGPALVGPILYTVDATDGARWRHFSFAAGTVVDDPGPTGWDLAFRRFQIIANGGAGFRGAGGVLDLGPATLATVPEVPAAGYRENEGGRAEPRNPAIAGWYRYGFFSHILRPRPHVWAVRTADGRYAKLEIVSYYCEDGRPGCLTFRYVYQGSGSTAMAPPRRPA